MDFQFENGTGPLDGRSPFAQVSSNARRIPEGVNTAARKSEHDLNTRCWNQGLTSISKGPYSAFDSPSKPRNMSNLQSSPSKPLPSIPAYSALYNTPRKPTPDIDDSSAGETPRSPEPRDDSDATPEITHTRSALTRFNSASQPTLAGAERERRSPTKQKPDPQRRDSFMLTLASKFKNKIYSPGRGEVPRTDHSGAIEKVSRRRKREVDRRVARKRRHSMSESGDDNDEPAKSPRKTSGRLPEGDDEKKPHWVTSFFTFISQHPGLPQTLSFYAQFVFNIFLLCCCAYLIYGFWSAVLGDVDREQHAAMVDVMADMAECARQYKANSCEPEKRLPYMQNVCVNWEKCMNRDPSKVGRARVSAHTFAQIFNSFVEPISYKAMLFTAILVFGCFGVSNFVCTQSHSTPPTQRRDTNKSRLSQAFGIFRSKAQQYQPNYGYGYGYGAPPPPTPQRSFSGQDGAFYAGTPWHQPPPGLGFEPQPSGGGYGQIDGQGSPVRRLVYN